jgi:acyl-coenzyme A thioesterase PaaI-like protein
MRAPPDLSEQRRKFIAEVMTLHIPFNRSLGIELVEACAQVLRAGSRVGVASMRVYARSDPRTTLAEGKGVYAIKRAAERNSQRP